MSSSARQPSASKRNAASHSAIAGRIAVAVCPINEATAQHLSASELEALALPAMPASKRGISALAKREGWSFVSQVARGGSIHCYSVECLPRPALDELRHRQRAEDPAPVKRVGRPKGTDFWARNPAVADAVLAYLSEAPRSSSQIARLLKASGNHEELPKRRVLQRFIAATEQARAPLLAKCRDPDAYRSKFKVALGRADADVTAAHQVWEIDTTPADVLTKGGRKAILQVIDRYSRRARFLVVDSESAQSVRRLLVGTIRAWGVLPRTIKVDNGSGFVNGSIATALEALGIEHRLCNKASPWEKPFVERLFGTFTRECAELLDGFAGHNVAEASRLRAAAKKRTGRAVIVPELAPEQLQAICDHWVDGEYHQRIHSTLGMTPMARWLASPERPRAAPSEAVLTLALSALVGPRKVTKRGVAFEHGRYWGSACAAKMGQTVIVRRDEDDLGELFLFDEDGTYLGNAVNHERSGLSQQEFTEWANRQQKAEMDQQARELRANKKRNDPSVARAAILRENAEAAGKVINFPTPTIPHSTPALDSMREIPPAPIAAATRATLDAIAAQPVTLTRLPSTPRQKIAEADALIAAAAVGQPVDPAELAAARLYATSSEYRAWTLVDSATAPARASGDPA